MRKIIISLCLLCSGSVVFAQVSGLQAYYSCNGNINDQSGNGRHGTVHGAVLTEDSNGNLLSAYSFDGVDDYVSLPSMGPHSSFTLLARIKSTAADTSLMNIFSGDNAAWYPSIMKGKVAWYVGGWGKGVTNVCDGQWHDIAYVFDNTVYTIYVDGVIEYSITGVSTITSGLIYEVGRIRRGGRYFHGIMDDISVYDRALFSDEIDEIFGRTQGRAGECEWACASPLLFTQSNVGIGTDQTHGYQLAVAGGIVTERVNVALQANWPDYVFDANHPLLDLTSLKKYIAENGHLPGLPSAEIVETEGYSLSDMDAKLLEKIEELILYVIRQDEVIQTQQQAIERLQAGAGRKQKRNRNRKQ